MRTHHAEIYAVANMKHGEVTHLVSDLFTNSDEAEADLKGRPEPGGSCYLEVVKATLAFGPKWS